MEFITLDGVMQARRTHRGHIRRFQVRRLVRALFHDFAGKAMAEQMKEPFSLLLGRKTFDIFAA